MNVTVFRQHVPPHGGFKNAGFVVRRNDIGMPLSVSVVKIDTGFSFNFRGAENIYTKSLLPFATGHKMKDQRDIQFGNNQTFEVEFEQLLPAQKEVFLKTFKHGLQLLDKRFIHHKDLIVPWDGFFGRQSSHGTVASEKVEAHEMIFNLHMRRWLFLASHGAIVNLPMGRFLLCRIHLHS
jgi:hypothetical protein